MSVHWFWIVGWFVTLFGLLGNAWIIFIIAKTRRLQTTANWFVLSLAIADLSVTCGYFPASFVCNVLVHSCRNSLRFNFHSSFTEASTFALIAVIAERYIAVVYSLKYVYFMTPTKSLSLQRLGEFQLFFSWQDGHTRFTSPKFRLGRMIS